MGDSAVINIVDYGLEIGAPARDKNSDVGEIHKIISCVIVMQGWASG